MVIDCASAPVEVAAESLLCPVEDVPWRGFEVSQRTASDFDGRSEVALAVAME